MPDESIKWLLGGSCLTSRGGFQDGKDKTAVQKFKDFLKKDPKCIKPQKLITSIETIAAAMGYRAVNAMWTEKPYFPETTDQELMYNKIISIMGSKIIDPIHSIYTERQNDELDNTFNISDTISKIIYGEPDYVVSSDSEAEEEEDKLPKNRLEQRKFRKYVEPKKFSWVGVAKEGRIKIRAHVSGTASIVMAAIDGLCNSGSNTDNWISLDKNFEKLCALIVIAAFERGDYHTLAESTAGILYYLAARSKSENKEMHPYDAFFRGLWMLESSCTNEKLDINDKMSLREAIVTAIQNLLKQVKKIDILDNFKINFIYEDKVKELELINATLDDIKIMGEIKGIDQIISDKFEDVEDLVSFIKKTQIEPLKEILLIISNKLIENQLITTPTKLNIFLNALLDKHGQKGCTLICNALKELFEKIIKNNTFWGFLTTLDTKARTVIVNVLKDELPNLIINCESFSHVVQCLDTSEDVLYLCEKMMNNNKLINIFTNEYQFRSLLYPLHFKMRTQANAKFESCL